MTPSVEPPPGMMRAYVESLFDDVEQRLALQRSVVMRWLDAAGTPASLSPREQVLREALQEAVAVLAETKQSFKSKRLGELRAMLERTLAGLDSSKR